MKNKTKMWERLRGKRGGKGRAKEEKETVQSDWRTENGGKFRQEVERVWSHGEERGGQNGGNKE